MIYSLTTRERRIAKKNKKGFTLIELIVVIAILAILAAIAIPAFTSQLERARLSTNAANIATLKSAAQIALAENGAPGTLGIQTWTGAAGVPSGGTDPFLANKYINTWPTDPWNKGGIYTLTISVLGVVAVNTLAPQ